jgi:L-tryptophan--pyruvate aminotransferase
MNDLDLCWGNTNFLYPFWKNLPPMTHGLDRDLSYAVVLQELLAAIRLLHTKEDNVSNPAGYEIVIGCGATQVIQAAIHALQPGERMSVVYAQAPYFMRFPDMAHMAGAHFVKPIYNGTYYDVEINTLPNNPDGEWLQKKSGDGVTVIHDLCYDWPQYMRDGVVKMSEDIMVFSLSKATGHASTRLGWALIRDPEVATKMRKFIEYQTCGVSIEAQNKAYQVLLHHWCSQNNFMEWGRAVMSARWKILGDLGFQVRNGIFLWEKNPERFEKLGIKGIGGEAFGATNEWIRLNMGCSDEDFQEFVMRVRNG